MTTPAHLVESQEDRARELWVQARLLLSAWRQHRDHPHCPHHLARVERQMKQVDAACTRLEPALDIAREEASHERHPEQSPQG